MTLSGFDQCEVCNAEQWRMIYEGTVRDGFHGSFCDGAAVARCGQCGVDRLAEEICPDEQFYETDAYRQKLGQGLTTGAYFATADELQRFAIEAIGHGTLRDKTIADVGCAGGSFLDHVTGIARRKLAIEPSVIYQDSLRKRGYTVFPYSLDAKPKFGGEVDYAVSLQVIEHVRNPRKFLADIKPLLAPGGRLLISTPNRRDILMDLLPDEFPSFFYRVVHRWYFDIDALADCAERAGFTVENARTIHRYGLSNALGWLRDRRPSGHTRLHGIEPPADRLWRGYLEDNDRADCIFMMLKVS
ncbi:MAG: class I SAM-dependent methyltransferase [Alphaproteobacteria bacterium]|nr:class I SAM-dependent methyltransferase [Alphaproteobacteria bacterium]